MRFSPEQQRFIRFVLSGGLSALLFFALYFLGLRLGLAVFAAHVGSYAMAFLFGYALQRWWTFEAAHQHRVALPRYLLVQACCAFFTGTIAQVVTSTWSLDSWLISVVGTIFAGGASYIASILWVFPRDHAKRSV